MDTKEKQSKNKNIKSTNTKKNNEKKVDNSYKFEKIDTKTLQEKILNNQKKIYDIKLRHLAHIENIKKDVEIEIKNIKTIRKEQFFKKIIPIINILEDILSFAKKLKLEQEPLIHGIELILKSSLKAIYKFGVKSEGKKNEVFNPKIHDIILTENSQEIQPNHIISVLKKGFSYQNTILRKACVTISKN